MPSRLTRGSLAVTSVSAQQDILQVVDVDAAGREARVGDDAAMQRQVGRDALDPRLVKRHAQARQGLLRGSRHGRSAWR